MASVVLQTTQLIQSVSTDVLIAAGALAALFFYGLYKGTSKLGSMLISVYIATVIFLFFPYTDKIVLASKDLNHAIWWAVIFFLVKIAIDRTVILPTAFSRVRNWIEISLFSLAIFASIIAILYSLLSFSAFYTPTIISLDLISSTFNLFWVLVASLLVLLGIVLL